MRGWRRPDPVPGAVRTAARTLGQGRVLAAAETATGSWVAGTRQALLLPREGGRFRPVGWEQIHRAGWDSEESTLRVEEVADFGHPMVVTVLQLATAGSLLELVRERVEASVLVQRRTTVHGRRGVTVVGRRSPAGDGPVAWAYELDPGLDPADPVVARAAQRLLAETRESLGL